MLISTKLLFSHPTGRGDLRAAAFGVGPRGNLRLCDWRRVRRRLQPLPRVENHLPAGAQAPRRPSAATQGKFSKFFQNNLFLLFSIP